ncbi:hypothetical protein CQP30_12135 [Yersinia pestis]|uniref:Uncharacterized protein n=2 Tax=Yersinia pestis TaxID=632 RepID=A0A0H2YAA3_YERPA|nr:conserved hypothetical protein [Yersinia pestis Antiqua]ADV97253.1 hypothetical protein YPC_0540 [Yersinia pestis biovar Medievalis str. Harbin 35]AYX21588.1 hypothetical protein EGX46_20865 [Yersinia pestis]EEO75729.1 hypothetical protein YP516_3662 [Yersinia pestis Nepal516]EEO82867.1 hypothetical protein YPF_0843 [Yersinia pestis biovar Orientalis str. India 195]EEO87349.1 hypothetical protein YPH_3288 [Yersinia pestis biovar Orientalis str. PEXU2]EIR06361.1 hypothetical protein YPPY04_
MDLLLLSGSHHCQSLHFIDLVGNSQSRSDKLTQAVNELKIPVVDLIHPLLFISQNNTYKAY